MTNNMKTFNRVNELLRTFRITFKKDPDLIVFNKPTFYEIYPTFVNDSDTTFGGTLFLINERTRKDVSFYMFNENQELRLIETVTFAKI